MEYKARITVYSSIGQVEEIKALAYADGTSLSDYISKLIEAHLSRERAKSAKRSGAPAPGRLTRGSDVAAFPGQTRPSLPEQDGTIGNG